MSASPEGPSSTGDAVVIQAPVQIPGRRFQPTVERSLDPELLLVGSRWRPGSENERLLLSECALPFGVPDLVVVSLDGEALQQRIDSGLPAFTSATDIKVLSSCSGRWRLRRSISADLGVSSGQADRVVARLIRLGALMEGEGRLRTASSIQPIGRVFAVEAKVSDWRAGVEQCLRYSMHAESATLVLGRLPSSGSAELRGLAAHHGVGVSHGGRWIVRPRIRRHTLTVRLQASEYVIRGLGSAE